MLYRKSTLSALMALIFLAFFGTLGVSAEMFPQNYDWRYRVISNLLSPRDNPGHYWLPACGTILAAVLMLPFAGYLRRNLEIASPRAQEYVRTTKPAAYFFPIISSAMSLAS